MIRATLATASPASRFITRTPVVVATLRRDVAHRHPDRDARLGHGDDVVVEADHERGGDEALLARQLDPTNALATPAPTVELVELGALAVPTVGDDEDRHVVTGEVARHHRVGRLT